MTRSVSVSFISTPPQTKTTKNELYSKYSRAAEEEKGKNNKMFYVITCTKCRKRMVEKIKHGIKGRKSTKEVRGVESRAVQGAGAPLELIQLL